MQPVPCAADAIPAAVVGWLWRLALVGCGGWCWLVVAGVVGTYLIKDYLCTCCRGAFWLDWVLFCTVDFFAPIEGVQPVTWCSWLPLMVADGVQLVPGGDHGGGWWRVPPSRVI